MHTSVYHTSVYPISQTSIAHRIYPSFINLHKEFIWTGYMYHTQKPMITTNALAIRCLPAASTSAPSSWKKSYDIRGASASFSRFVYRQHIWRQSCRLISWIDVYRPKSEDKRHAIRSTVLLRTTRATGKLGIKTGIGSHESGLPTSTEVDNTW